MHARLLRRRLAPARGFTLVEMLVVTAIIGILATLTVAGVSSAMMTARLTRETAAGKSLISAYLAYPADNNGKLLAGMDYRVTTMKLPDGTTASPAHVGQRYPFRLAPYFNNVFEGNVLVNRNVDQINKMAPPGNGMRNYIISAFPAFGINYYFVGGNINSSGTAAFPNECLTNLASASAPLIVFASGGSGTGSDRVDGFNILTPPHLTGQVWSASPWKADNDPGDWGNVDARYNGRAVIACLDGSVRAEKLEDLRDMTLWNKNAAAQGNKDYSISQ